MSQKPISAEAAGMTDPQDRKEWDELTPDEQRELLEAQVVGDVSQMAQHELPPELRATSNKTVFSEEQAVAMGLSDAEVVKLRQSGAMTSSGLLEYDEEAETERLHRLREQQRRMQTTDGGDMFAVQVGQMERYFRGLDKNPKTGKFCQRLMTTLTKDEVVGINGYIFNIPKFRPVPLPTEVLAILEQTALATNQHAIYSAIVQARATRPITLEDFMSSPPPESHLAMFAGRHPVRDGGPMAPYRGSVSPFVDPRG